MVISLALKVADRLVVPPLMTNLMVSPATAFVPTKEVVTLKPLVASLALIPELIFAITVGATGVLGAIVSKVKLLLPSALVLPALSVALALTLIVPLPKVVRSALVKVTACEAPVPVKDLVTVLAPLVKVTETAAPLSAVRVTTPPACVASVAVAPPATPVPSAKTGALGAIVSTLKVKVLEVPILPAVSVWVIVILSLP